jgi:hypothetical protein
MVNIGFGIHMTLSHFFSCLVVALLFGIFLRWIIRTLAKFVWDAICWNMAVNKDAETADSCKPIYEDLFRRNSLHIFIETTVLIILVLVWKSI